jgi:hypothetical protein
MAKTFERRRRMPDKASEVMACGRAVHHRAAPVVRDVDAAKAFECVANQLLGARN